MFLFFVSISNKPQAKVEAYNKIVKYYGTRVLGLGDIGPEGVIPVMEGKSVLFKVLGGINAFPLCIDTKDKEEIIRFVQSL